MSASRALVLLSLLVAAPALAETTTVRRLALLVGVNDGGAERVRLRYAVSDARSFDKVLGELGGVSPADRRLLLETGRAGLVEALAELRARTQAARASGASRVEVLVYYSGHSDEEGLLLKGERMDYGELRRALEALPADVRIAVLDSCASGAFARAKGGTRRPAFLVDSGNKVRGHAILTSSSEDETSQESDRLGGSYFTHHLVSGLRGAADTTHDGRVTLNEAYQFAFHETLARTEKTRGGAQHPAYDIELAGSGDLVMTDLRATSAGLYLAEALEGRLFVRDAAGNLVVELRKLPGRPTELGLAPGRYSVRRELEGGVSEASFTLAEGQLTPLVPAQFAGAPLEATVSRGGPEVSAAALGVAAAPSVSEASSVVSREGRAVVPFAASLFPPLSTNKLFAPGRRVENQWAVGGVSGGAALRGMALSLVANWYTEEAAGVLLSSGVNVVGGSLWGVQLAAGFNVTKGSLRGLQLSMGLNSAGNVTGLQAAVLNVGGDVTGAQLGLINVAKVVTGVQLGLINVSEEVRGVPLGLLSFEKKGQFHVEAWASDIQLTNLAVKFGGKYVYTTLLAGIGPDDRLQRFSLGLGLGVHLPLGQRLWLDGDVAGSSVRPVRDPFGYNANLLAQGRLMLGVDILERLAVFGGVTYNTYFAWSDADRRTLSTLPVRQRQLDETTTVQYWPGLQLGVRI